MRKHFQTAGELLSPDLVLAEVARKSGRDGLNLGPIEGHLRPMGSLSSIVGVDSAVALATVGAESDLRRHAKLGPLDSPSFADCIVLATARCRGALVLTADRHFEGLTETEWVGG